jgi:hypothetical protein
MTPTGDLLTSLQHARRLLERAGERAFERQADGTWNYRETDIPVVAAEDVTLNEQIAVRQVARLDRTPEAVLVSAREIVENDALAWVRSRGRRLRSDDGDELFEVPWAVWQEHAATPVGVRAPERDASGLAQLVAIEERELRFARREAELRAERRARYVAIMASIGMTRREIGQCIGLSTGRVQQVVEDLPASVRAEVDELLRDALRVLRQVGPRSIPRDEVELPASRDEALLDELVAYGLLEQDGGVLHLAEAGEQAELHLRMKRKS